jgi:hypothetical protein
MCHMLFIFDNRAMAAVKTLEDGYLGRKLRR